MQFYISVMDLLSAIGAVVVFVTGLVIKILIQSNNSRKEQDVRFRQVEQESQTHNVNIIHLDKDLQETKEKVNVIESSIVAVKTDTAKILATLEFHDRRRGNNE